MSLLFKFSNHTTRQQAKIAIIIAVILVLSLNIFSTQFSYRFDLTENKDYSLTDASKGVIDNLKDSVTITAYFSQALPGYLAASNQAVRDLLAEYEKAGKGKILLTYLDPSKDKKIEQEANGLGIPPLQFNVIQKDKYEVSNGYLGLAISAGEKKEIIPMADNTANLEYSLTAAISKATRAKTPTIAFLTNDSNLLSPDQENNLRVAGEILGKQYFVRDFSFATSSSIPSDIDVLIIPGIKKSFSKQEQYAIDQFLMRDKSLAILSEGVKVDLSTLSAQKGDNSLADMLSRWGVKIVRELTLDTSNEMQGFSNNIMQFFAPYPFLVKITKNGFAKDSGIVNKLETAVFPFVSPIEILQDKLTDKTKAVALAQTTPNAWTQADNFILNPQAIPAPQNGGQKQRAVAVMLAGRFASSFTADTIPLADGQKKISSDEKKNFKAATNDGRLIVVGDSDFFTDPFLQRFQGNSVFFGNIIDALAGDQSLISIRSKAVTDRPLKEVSDSAKSAIKWLNILGMSALFAAYGLIRSIRRKKGLLDYL